MSQRRWTAEVFVDSSVGSINPVVEAGTLHGAKQQIERLYGPVTQISNIQELPRDNGGRSSSTGGGGGLGGLLGFVVLIGAGVVIAGGGGGDSSTPSPSQPSYQAPVERSYQPSYQQAPAPSYYDNSTKYQEPVTIQEESTSSWDTDDDEDPDDTWWE